MKTKDMTHTGSGVLGSVLEPNTDLSPDPSSLFGSILYLDRTLGEPRAGVNTSN